MLVSHIDKDFFSSSTVCRWALQLRVYILDYLRVWGVRASVSESAILKFPSSWYGNSVPTQRNPKLENRLYGEHVKFCLTIFACLCRQTLCAPNKASWQVITVQVITWWGFLTKLFHTTGRFVCPVRALYSWKMQLHLKPWIKNSNFK